MTNHLGPILAALIATAAVAPPSSDGEDSPTSGLAMSKAVAVTRVDGLEKFALLEGAKLTSEDKLKVYFRPLNYKVERTESGFRAVFTEDGRVRRKGEKTALSKEDKLLDYEHRFQAADTQIYLVNTIGLKNIPPGEYEFDIILHDSLEPGSAAMQTLPFTIIPLPKPDPAAKSEGPDEPGGGPAGPVEKAKPKGKAKGARPRKPAG